MATENADGSFRVLCDLSHEAQVDPIVNPGPAGTHSQHLHQFFGNPTTDSSSTYQSMVAANATTCGADGDTAGYWSPALLDGNGNPAPVSTSIFYYRNRPYDYGTTAAFPPDLRVIAGGPDADAKYDVTYWTCDGESDTGLDDRKNYIPDCGDDEIKLHIWFPSCWDGVNLDSADHRSHMAYGIDDDGPVDPTDPDLCPPSHPVKVPQLNYRIQFEITDGTGYHLSDGNVLAHADFWNTWNQTELRRWVAACHNTPQSCDEATGSAPATGGDGCGTSANGWPHKVVNGFSTRSGDGFWLAHEDGAVVARGDAQHLGDAACLPLNGPILGGAISPDERGYWLNATDGGVFSYGDASFHGSMGDTPLNQPIFSMTPTRSGEGYWLVAYDGGIFSFGDAAFFGSTGDEQLVQPINGITTSPSGRGYRMVARDGGVFNFGDVDFYGSLPGLGILVNDVIGMAPTPSAEGYWVARANGRVYAFGNARDFGDFAPAAGESVVAIFSNPDEQGYRLVLENGRTVAFGNAPG